MTTVGAEAATVSKGTTPTTLGRAYLDEGVTFVKVEAVTADGFIDPVKVSHIDEGTNRLLRRSQLREDDVLFSIAGALGRSAVVGREILPANTNQALAFIRLRENSRLNPRFLWHYTRSHAVAEQVERINVQGAQANLSLRNVRDLIVPAPPLREQRAIVEILDDANALTLANDRLIRKKRDLLAATAHQLLRGESRLPGFDQEWVERTIGEVAEIVSGGTPSTAVAAYWDGGINWCTPRDITRTRSKYLSDTERTISGAGLANSAARVLPIGALLLCSRATVGEVRIARVEVSTNQGFKSLVTHPGTSNEFLYYALLSLKRQMIDKAVGSTFLEISRRDTASLPLNMPPLAEQVAIAKVLADMDAEIEALSEQARKTRALNMGMAQELLSGRTRLT